MRTGVLASVAMLFCAAAGPIYGSCTASSPYVCTGGGITIGANNQTGVLNSNAQTVSGLAGTISKVTVKLNNWTDNGSLAGDADREMMLVFQPAGCGTSSCLQTFQFLGGFGSYESLSNYNVTFDDSAINYAPDFFDNNSISGDGPPVNNATYKSTVNEPGTYCSGDNPSAAFGGGAPVSSAPCANDNRSDPTNEPTVSNPKTFASQFSGSPNGTWTLYIWSYAGSEDSAASIGTWAVTITTQVNVTPTTTSLSSSQTNNEAFENASVTFFATVNSSAGTVNGGTVAFTDNGNTISGCGSQPVSNGSATCNTSFSTEGYHPIEAAYSGDTNFGASQGGLNFFVDHTTSNPSSGVYCNTGTITINTNTQPGTTPYPQHIFIPSTSASISDISLTLNSINAPSGIDFFNFLLVDPNGHKFVPLAGTGGFGAASSVTLTLSDFGASPVPNPTTGAAASGTYLPTDDNGSLTFGTTSYPYNPPAGPYQLAPTQGSASFDSTFAGFSPTGMWSLYAYYASGQATGSIGGYCLNITTSNAASTTTTLTSSPNVEALTGEQVTFTATVKSGANPVTSGTVTFKENGTTLSGPTALNGSGQATFQTSSLSEGIHTITANYSGVTGTFNVSSGSVTIEIDTATTNPSPGVYCNPGGINISGTNAGTNIPASPYPSRINVTGIAGTVNTIGVQLNNFSDAEPDGSVMLLEGPTSTNLVFWNDVGSANTGFSALNLAILDAAGTPLPADPNNPTNGSYRPASYTGLPAPVFPAPAPSALSFAPPQGTQNFTSAFQGINPNGYWSLYLYDRFGDAGVSINNWCVNVANNPPVVTLAKIHNGTFTQGDTADTYTITVANPSGPGSTAGTMTLTDTLPSGMTAVGMQQTAGGTGSDWTCSTATTSCTRTTPMAPGESDAITLTVSVSYSTSTATNGAVNNVSLSGGGISGAPVTAQDTQTVQVGQGYTLNLSVNPSGSGTVSANPTNSAGLSAGHYVPGATVTLTATQSTGYAFSSWSGSADLSSTSSNPTTITMNSATENVTANFVVAYTNVTSSVSVVGSGFVYNRVKHQGTETMTITNTSSQTISGPIQLVLGLGTGITGANNTGTFQGNPYWTVTTGSLAPGASAQVTVTLNYALGTNVTATSNVYSGNLQ